MRCISPIFPSFVLTGLPQSTNFYEASFDAGFLHSHKSWYTLPCIMSKTLRRVVKYGLAATMVAGPVALIERIADPWDRHDPAYTLEGPPQGSEVLYVSVNSYDPTGEKHDDRVGDALIVATIGSVLGGVALRLTGSRDHLAEATPTTSS